LLLWSVEEIESLRLSSDEYEEIVIESGSVVPLNFISLNEIIIIIFL
jgi:beta-fructofuranosidase